MIRTYRLLLIGVLLFVYIQDASCGGEGDKNAKKGFADFFKFKSVFHTHKTAKPAAIPTSINAIVSYHAGFKLYANLIRAKILINNYPSTSSLSELEKACDEVRDLGSIYDDLMRLGKQVVTEIDGQLHFEPKDYLKQAAYYRILRWLQAKMQNNKDISAIIDGIIAEKKARNYLAEIYQPNKGPQWIDSDDSRLLTVHGWVEGNPYDKYDHAVHFMKQIVQNKGETADKIAMECTDVAIYEEILADADPTLFKEVFEVDPCEMIEIVDKAIAKKISVNQLQVEFPYHEAQRAEEIDLSQISGNMKRFKYATILFARAFQQKFEIDALSKQTQTELENFSVGYSKIRYCSFQSKLASVPVEMNTMLSLLNGLDLMTERCYFHRLLRWFEEFSTDKTFPLGVMKTKLGILTSSPNAKHILAVMSSRRGISEEVFGKIIKNTFTLRNLLDMGQQTDRALSTLMRVTLNELQNDRKNLQNKISRSGHPTEENSEFTDKVQEIQNYIDTVLLYGMPEIHFDSDDFRIFNNLKTFIDQERFKSTFGKDLSDILNKVNAITHLNRRY